MYETASTTRYHDEFARVVDVSVEVEAFVLNIALIFCPEKVSDKFTEVEAEVSEIVNRVPEPVG